VLLVLPLLLKDVLLLEIQQNVQPYLQQYLLQTHQWLFQWVLQLNLALHQPPFLLLCLLLWQLLLAQQRELLGQAHDLRHCLVHLITFVLLLVGGSLACLLASLVEQQVVQSQYRLLLGVAVDY
jgi:hypothetical protein